MTSLKTKGKSNPELVGEAEFNKKWEHENNFLFLRKSNDPRFGEITIYKSKVGNDLVFSKEQLTSSKVQTSADIRDLNARVSLNHDNVQRLLGHSYVVQKELCSTNYFTKMFYEFPKSDLHKAIDEKKSRNEVFRSEELINIGNQALRGLNHLHRSEVAHGDVKPLSIGYNKETGKVQILDRLNNPAPTEQLQKKNIVENKDLFMSPELYKQILGKDKSVKYDPYQNDLYGLGLSLLTAGNGEKLQNLYLPNGEFNQNSLKNHLDKFDEKYEEKSPKLSQFVRSLLNANPDERKTAQKYIDYIDKQQNSIIVPEQKEKNQMVYAEAPQTETTTIYNLASQTNQVVYGETPESETTVIYNLTPQTNDTGIESNTTYQSYIVPETKNSTYDRAPVQYRKASNVVYSQAPVKYVSSPVVYNQPAQTYVYSRPSNVIESPVTYTTYDQAPIEKFQTKNIVYSQAPPVYENYSRSDENITSRVYASAPVNDDERLVTVQRIDGTSYTYKASNKNDLENHHDYDKYDPRNQGNGQERGHNLPIQSSAYYPNSEPKQTMTYVSQSEPSIYITPSLNVSNVRYVQSAYPGENVVSSPVYHTNFIPQPRLSYQTEPVTIIKSSPKMSNVRYVQSVPGENVVYNSPNNITYVNSGPEVRTYSHQSYVVNEPFTQHKSIIINSTPSTNIEVRKSYSTPHQSETKVIRSSYVVEGDKIIEVNHQDQD